MHPSAEFFDEGKTTSAMALRSFHVTQLIDATHASPRPGRLGAFVLPWSVGDSTRRVERRYGKGPLMETDARRLKIVVADDDLIVRSIYQQMLPRLGHEVVGIARDGIELVDYVHQRSPDLVITDIDMPRLNGIEAMQRFAASIPCIVVSGSPLPTELLVSKTTQEIIRLNKPFHFRDLAAAIASAQVVRGQTRQAKN